MPRNPIPSVEVQKAYRRFYFVYQTPNVASLAAAASASNTINFDQDSSFVWLKTTYSTDLAGAAITSGARIVPLATLQITDQGSGQGYFNAPVPIPSIAGDSGSLPFILPAPQLIAPTSTYVFAFNNFSAATTYANLRIQLIGYKVYNT